MKVKYRVEEEYPVYTFFDVGDEQQKYNDDVVEVPGEMLDQYREAHERFLNMLHKMRDLIEPQQKEAYEKMRADRKKQKVDNSFP